MDLSLEAIAAAKDVDLSSVTSRLTGRYPCYPDVWPGEHYKLLAGFMRVMKPRKVMEIGTFEGLSALSMLAELPCASTLITVDIVPWKDFATTALQESDFASGQLVQVIGDLSQGECFERVAGELRECDFLFVDGPKDILFETALFRQLEATPLKEGMIVFLDDIRLWNMLSIWRGVARPKLDLTSFGHWTGSGVIDWCACS
jgi:predicted O-methyltransferase YrrM